MNHFIDFLFAALPWLCMGLMLALFFAKSAQRKRRIQNNRDEWKKNYSTEGMCLGMCFGSALGVSIGNNTGIVLSLGMLLGFAIGSWIERKDP